MNDSEMFDRLQRIDPLRGDVRITPAHSVQALTLMESIMTTELKNQSTDRTSGTGDVVETTRIAPRSRRRWFTVAGVGTAAAAVTVVVLSGVGGSGAALARRRRSA